MTPSWILPSIGACSDVKLVGGTSISQRCMHTATSHESALRLANKTGTIEPPAEIAGKSVSRRNVVADY